MNDFHHLFILSNNNLIEKNTDKLILQHPIESTKSLLNDDVINKNNIIIEIYGGHLVTLFND